MCYCEKMVFVFGVSVEEWVIDVWMWLLLIVWVSLFVGMVCWVVVCGVCVV